MKRTVKRKGRTIEFDSPHENGEALARLMVINGPRDEGFAASLLRQAATDRGLSELQWAWVHFMVWEDEHRPEPMKVAAVSRMFWNARTRLKHPSITFKLPWGKLRFAPSRQHDDRVNVTDGKRYPDTTWYGRIEDGTYFPTRDVPDWVPTCVKALAEDPAAYCGSYGQATGHCCFCTRPLTDYRSVRAGYGPVCAGNYGLPWGDEDDDEGEKTGA